MEISTLSSGLRVVTKNLPGTAAVTVLVLAGAGSRYETCERGGLSHFLEHMFFKGGEKFKNTREVSEAIDSIGGEFNAFTGKEYAGYYVKAAREHLDTAFDVLADMLCHATFPAEEIEKERGVILEEYNMYLDTPMYQVGWDFEKLCFGDQPLGRDQIGTPELIRSFQRDDFVKYKKELYTPDNLVIAVSGNCEHAEVVRKIEEFFQFSADKKAFDWQDLQPHTPDTPVFIKNKKTEQGHIVFGVEALPADDERQYVQKILATVLGGNMSSRMFLNVREAKGLCYYIRTSTDEYRDAGLLSTTAGVDVTRLTDATAAIRDEYLKIADGGIDEAELDRAKNFLRGRLALRLEDSEEYAHFLAKQFLLSSEQFEISQIFEKIDAVTTDEVQKLSKEIFAPQKFRFAAIGPFADRKNEIAKILLG